MIPQPAAERLCSKRWMDASLVCAPGKPQHIWFHTGCTDWLPICLKGNAARTNCFFTPADSNPLATSYYYLTIISGYAVFDFGKKKFVYSLILNFFFLSISESKEPTSWTKSCLVWGGSLVAHLPSTLQHVHKSHAARCADLVNTNKARKPSWKSTCIQKMLLWRRGSWFQECEVNSADKQRCCSLWNSNGRLLAASASFSTREWNHPGCCYSRFIHLPWMNFQWISLSIA